MIDVYRIIENLSSMFIGSLIIFVFLIILFPNSIVTMWDQDTIVKFSRTDNMALSIATVCETSKTNLLKFLCVYEFYKDNYNYSVTFPSFKSPVDTIINGGDCLDTSYFYCSVFSILDGFECKVVHLPDINHAMSVVTFPGKYCILDMTFYQCVSVGGEV